MSTSELTNPLLGDTTHDEDENDRVVNLEDEEQEQQGLTSEDSDEPSDSLEESAKSFDTNDLDSIRPKKTLVHKLKGLLTRKRRTMFFLIYAAYFLLMLMVFVPLNQQDPDDEPDRSLINDFACPPESRYVNSFCGCEGFQLIARFFEHRTGITRFFSRCFLELVFAYALYFSSFTFLFLWLLAFRPWKRPSRPSLRLHHGSQLATAICRIICAFLIAIIPDPRTVADLFAFSHDQRLRVPPVTSVSDAFRTISWILIFITILFTFVRQAPIPLGLRQFSGVYVFYRTLWFFYNIVNDEHNDGRLYFEGVSYASAVVFCTLMMLPLRFRSLEPEEGRMHLQSKKKDVLRWPGPRDIWQLLGTYGRRFLAVICLFVACAEGVVRVLTFQQLGIALVSCFPQLATCDEDNLVIYHNLPKTTTDIERLIPFFAFAVSVAFLRASVRILSTYVMQMTINHLKDELFGRALSCTRIYIRSAKADINQTIHYYLDREFLKTLLQKMPEAIVPVVSIVTTVAILFTLSWRLSIIISSILVFFIMFTIWRNYYTSVWQKRYLDMRDKERYLTADVFNGFEAVQFLAQEEHERSRLKKVLRKTLVSARALYAVDIFGDFTESQILTGAVMIGVGYGATLISSDEDFDTVALAQYGTISFNAINAIKQVTEFVTQVGKSKAASDHVLRLRDDRTHDARLDAIPPPRPEPDLDIELKNVYFAYQRPKDPDTPPDYKMKDVSVSIPQGKSLGLVGHTGCGKSTMIKLILKEYDIEPGEGNLTLGGRDIKDVSARWLYSKVAYVPQKPTMFDESIYYNLTYGWPKDALADPAAWDQLKDLLEAVGLHEFLEMGEKDMVMLEKKAGDTSGGQQQRIGIVRALLGKPKLMVLDEITSALDGSTEAAVMNLIREHARANNATTIIIAHRYATIEHVDEVLVIEEGAIVERGTFNELKSKPNGKFYALLNTE